MDCVSVILILLAFIQATCGQTVTVTGPSAVEQGRDTVFTCTGGASPYTFTWTDISVNPNINIFINGEKFYPPEDTKYVNFEISENGGTSTMTIINTQIEDAGQYRCSEGQASDVDDLTVEVQSTRALSVVSTLLNNIDMYEATCEVLEGRPNETITWMLDDGGLPCDDIVVTYLAAGQGLFSKRSVCTFQADSENYGQTLRCVIGGHQVSGLDGEETTTLDIHSAPTSTGIMTVGFLDPDIRVSCDIADEDQPNPRIRNYYIYSNDTLIHQSTTGVNFTDVESDFDLYTNFTCVAGNYLGNITTTARYDPNRPTTPPPTTAPAPAETTSPETNDAGNRNDPGPSIAAIVGGVIGGILLVIIILLIIWCVKKKYMGGSGSSGGGPRKPTSSAVGSSNGNEKEKIKPSAAPRTASSIQHTTDNPDQAEYAMVDRKPAGGKGGGGGGDVPDTRGGYGAGQNEPGMVYADLDLSSKAGHTERQVPKDTENVVVYSSILV